MTLNKKWSLPILITLLLIAFYVFERPAMVPSSRTDSHALNRLTLSDIAGKPQPLQQWQGQPRLINFWAPWCTPCREELPLLNHLYPAWHSRGVIFIGIAMDQPDTVRQFTQKTPLSYPDLIGQDDTLSLTRAWGNAQQGLPMTLLIDAKDHIRWIKLGRLNDTELRAALDQLVSPP